MAPATDPTKEQPSNPGPPTALANLLEMENQKEAETPQETRARLRELDKANRTASPLFQMILPAPMQGYFIFVMRAKFKELANNVLTELAAFLITNLDLWRDPGLERKVLRKWLCRRHYAKTGHYAMVWDHDKLKAVSEHDKNATMDIDETDEWLNALIAAPEPDTFQGQVSIDLAMATVTDIDEGVTVASDMNEQRRLQAIAEDFRQVVLENAQKDETIKKAALEGAQKDAEIERLRAQLAKPDNDEQKPSASTKTDSSASSGPDAGGGSAGEGP